MTSHFGLISINQNQDVSWRDRVTKKKSVVLIKIINNPHLFVSTLYQDSILLNNFNQSATPSGSGRRR